MHKECTSLDHCALCARLHPTNSCSNTNVCECVSCGSSSNHASSDHSTCPTYTNNSVLLDTRIPENTLPYFPILGVPWTIVTTAINSHTHTATPSQPLPLTSSSHCHPSQPPVSCLLTPVGGNSPPAPNIPSRLINANLTQATINGCSRTICPQPPTTTPTCMPTMAGNHVISVKLEAVPSLTPNDIDLPPPKQYTS